MIRGGRVPDLPGVRYHLLRMKKDFNSLETRTRNQRRSKFGVKDTINQVERLKKKVAKAAAKKKKENIDIMEKIQENKKKLQTNFNKILSRND